LASECGVDKRTIQRLKQAVEAGLGERVVAGELSAYTAAKIAKPGQSASGSDKTRPTLREVQAERDSLAQQLQERETRILELETTVSSLNAENHLLNADIKRLSELARNSNVVPDNPQSSSSPGIALQPPLP
jgi:septal ring factor EnvC (AmiA/AmiB activator)